MCQGITSTIIVILNLIYLLTGLTLLTIGSLLRWNKDMLKSIFTVVLNHAKPNMTAEGERQVNEAVGEIQKIISPIALFLFLGGIAIFVISLLAFIGLSCKLRCMLMLYAGLVATCISIHVLIMIVYFSEPSVFLKSMHSNFNQLLTEYVSVENGDSVSIAVAIVMPTLKCCGYMNGTDFRAHGSRFSGRDKLQNQELTNLKYPLPCCIPDKTGTDPDQCPSVFNNITSYIHTGCKDQLDSYLQTMLNRSMRLSIIILALEVALLAMVGFYLCCQ